MSSSVLTHPQFLLLQAIAKQSCSASELAQTVNASLPYVLSQLKLLEARNIVKKKQIKDGSVGKPKQEYSIASPFTHITQVSPYAAIEEELSSSKEMQAFIHITLQLPKQIQATFAQYYWTYTSQLQHLKALALLQTNSKTVELLGICDQEHLEQLRKEAASFSSKHLQIACWMHTLSEIATGLENNDVYYTKLKKQIQPLYDPQNLLEHYNE
jgi:DNA-binding transcriptional regulator GbsR (MarR family)